jgi:hypothetical protein
MRFYLFLHRAVYQLQNVNPLTQHCVDFDISLAAAG